MTTGEIAGTATTTDAMTDEVRTAIATDAFALAVAQTATSEGGTENTMMMTAGIDLGGTKAATTTAERTAMKKEGGMMIGESVKELLPS